jgi:hypothetical protein
LLLVALAGGAGLGVRFPDLLRAKTSSAGFSRTEPFLLAYGQYDQAQLELLAQKFSPVVMGPGYMSDPAKLRRLHELNPKLKVLDYAAPDAMRPYFPDWGFVNSHEEMFVHSANPASPVATWTGKGILITWTGDRRDTFPVAGYVLYRGLSQNQIGERIGPNPITDTAFTDVGAAPGATYWYILNTRGGDGSEYTYSQPFTTDTAAPSSEPALTSATNSGSTPGTTIVFRAVCSGQNTSVTLHVDVNRNHRFDEPGETAPMRLDPKDPTSFQATMAAPDQGGLPYYVECSAGGPPVRLPTEGAYVTNVNNRLHNPDVRSDYDLMNVANSSWQQHFVQMTLQEVQQLGYDGLLVDTVGADIPYWESDATPQGSPYYSPEAWNAGVRSMLTKLRSGLAAKTLFYNGGDSFLDVADGVLSEGWGHPNWTDNYPTEQQWIDALDYTLAIEQYPKVNLLVSGGRGSDAQSRMYSFASFLLVADGQTRYAYLPDYLNLQYYPEYDLDLGQPWQRARNAAELLRAGSNVYAREFSKGTAFVNPSETAQHVALDGSYSLVELTGGGTANGGSIQRKRVSSLDLPAHSGAVVLKS